MKRQLGRILTITLIISALMTSVSFASQGKVVLQNDLDISEYNLESKEFKDGITLKDLLEDGVKLRDLSREERKVLKDKVLLLRKAKKKFNKKERPVRGEDLNDSVTLDKELIYKDDFEKRSFADYLQAKFRVENGWIRRGIVYRSEFDEYKGDNGVRFTADSGIEKHISTVGYENITLKYMFRGVNLYTNELLATQWSADGGETWTAYGDIETSQWKENSFDLPEEASNNPNLIIRINVSPIASNASIDDVMILGDAIN